MAIDKSGIGHWARLTLLCIPALAATVATAEAPKKPSPWLDIPWVVNAKHTSENNWVWAECSRVSASKPRQVDCTISGLLVMSPKLDKYPVEYWQKVQVSKWAKALQDVCTSYVKSSYRSSDRVEMRRKVLEACSKKDAASLAAAHLEDLGKEAETCTIVKTPPFTWRFTQVTADMWTYATDPAEMNPEERAALGKLNSAMGIPNCHAITTATLWRPNGDATLWNYSQERTIPPNDPEACRYLTTRRDWTFFDHDRLPLTCKYLGP